MTELKLNANGETGCCPRFNPDPWQEKEITWQNKLFLKDNIRSFFHVPLNMNQVMTKNVALIEKAGAKNLESIMIVDEKSLWGADIYIAIDREVPGAQTVKISGTYLTKVFEGPYSKMGEWIKEMQKFVAAHQKTVKKLYFSYTTCPACAKAYGKNYVVIFAEI
jgi:hypothetical protein